MYENEFVHLHVHTVYSTKDGAIKLDELAKKCKDNNMPACAMTDHGNGHGFVDFYKTMTKHNLKPILGYESYTCVPEVYKKALESKDTTTDRDLNNHHLVLLAKNNQGYKNLLKMISYENTIGFVKGGLFAKGNLDLNFVKENNLGEGIIALTACLGGTTSKLILHGLQDKAVDFVKDLDSIFEDVYIEVQHNTTDEQSGVNYWLCELSKQTGIPLVATKDAHYLDQADWEAHDALLAQQVNKKIDDPDRWRFPGGPEYYLATPKEMQRDCATIGIPEEAYNNTIKIANSCNVCLFADDTGRDSVYGGSLFPSYTDIPKGYNEETYLRKLSMDGLIDFIKNRPDDYSMNVKEYVDRLHYELDIITSMNYSGYFLILWDFMKFCKDYKDPERPNGIGTGAGRGSGVGSLVCRSLEITKIDPIRYDLIFERFLNPERESIPDVDLDVSDLDRHLVIDYLKDTYGENRVGQIATFSTIKVGGGFRNLMRLKGLDKKQQDEVCKRIPAAFPNQVGTDLKTLLDIPINPDKYKEVFDQKFPQALKMSEEFTEAVKTQPWVLKQMEKLEGCITAVGAHAGGILVFPDDSSNYVPLTKPTGAALVPVSQFDMDAIEDINALKIDVLGLTTSRKISRTAQKVGIDIDKIDLKDADVFKMLRDGHSTSVFQFSGAGMTKALIDAKVKDIEDLIAIVSIYRPGPLDAVNDDTGMTIYETYIEACQTGKDTECHPRLEHILKPSKNNMIYQEQIMKVVMEMGGCTLGYADIIRRACAKKKISLMKELGKEFKYGRLDENGNHILKDNGEPLIKGAINNGFTEHETDVIWNMIVKFSGYAFNKSHAAAYGLNAYQTAYLKYHYPAEFLSEELTSLDKQEDIARVVKEAKRLGVPVLPPDVNNSDSSFTVETLDDGRKAIRFGLQAIKGINNTDAISDIRPISGVKDFFERVDQRQINKGKAEKLILAGGFDSFEPNRHKVYNHYFSVIRADKPTDEDTFDELKANKKHAKYFVPLDENSYSEEDGYKYEEELIGMYVSGHPLDKYPYTPWVNISPNESVECIGVVKRVNVRQDRKGGTYSFFTIECLEDVRECVIWSNQYSKYGDRLEKGAILKFRGQKQRRRGYDDQLVVKEILVTLKDRKQSNTAIQNKPVVSQQLDDSGISVVPDPMQGLFDTGDINDIIYGEDPNSNSDSDLANLF